MSPLYAAESLILPLGNHSYSGELLAAMTISSAPSWDKPYKRVLSSVYAPAINGAMQLPGRCRDPLCCGLTQRTHFASAEENLQHAAKILRLLPKYWAPTSPACSRQGQ